MSIRHRLLVALVATTILGTSCADGDVNTIEPLRGHASSAETTEPVGSATDGSGEAAVGGEATDAPGGPAPTPASSTLPTSPPIPVPSGDAGGVAGVADYCTLFEQYGSVMAAVNSALESGRAEQISAALQRAVEVHGRAAEIGPTAGRADHQDVAAGLIDLDALLAEYGYDPGRLFAAADADPAVAARLDATTSPAVEQAMQRSAQQVLSSCGITLA